MECPAPRQETEELKDALAKEKALCSDQQNSIKELRKQLDETKEELKRQKSLKETFINKAKETNRHLERLKTYCDPHTLRAANIADPSETTREKKKRVLHDDYEELQVAYIISQEKFTAELQAEKEKNQFLQAKLDTSSAIYHDLNKMFQNDANKAREQADTLQCELEKESQQRMILLKYYEELKAAYIHIQETSSAELQEQKEKNKLLQEELENISVSYQEISQRYETDILAARQQADTLQCQLDREIEAHSESLSQSFNAINKLKAALCQKVVEETNNMEQEESPYKRELEKLKAKLNDQISRNKNLSTELEAERKDNPPPINMARHEEKHEDEPSPAPAVDSPKQVEVTEELPNNQQASTSDAPDLEHQPPPDLPPINMARHEEKHEDEPCPAPVVDTPSEADDPEELWNNQQASTSDASDLEHQEEAEISEETPQPKTPSFWKRTRHFLGLRKPQKWKNRNKDFQKHHHPPTSK